MTKFRKILSKTEKDKLFIKFAESLASLHSAGEMAQFIQDLLSSAEISMLARRLQIAELLQEGQTYQQIKEALNASFGTIARVHTWMQLYGEGYRTVLKRTAKNKTNSDLKSFGKLKRKYPSYFWPQLLVEEIIRSSSKKQKAKMRKILDQSHEKSGLNKQLDQLLKV